MNSQSWVMRVCARPQASVIRIGRSSARVKLVLRRWAAAVSFALVGMSACAEIETRCTAYVGDLFVSPLSVAGYLYQEPVSMRSATEEDGPISSNECGVATLSTVQSGGPYFVISPFDGYALLVTYFDRIEATPFWSRDKARCVVGTAVHRFREVDESGVGEVGGAGTACATRLRGPEMVVEPLTLRTGKWGRLNVRVFTDNVPYAWKEVNVSLEPVAGSGSLWCARKTNAQGILACDYRAPKTEIVERVIGGCESCGAPVHGTITVTKSPIVLGYFNGVWNTDLQAGLGLNALKELMGPAHDRVPIRFEYFHNTTGAGTPSTRWQDLAETFAQRGDELDRVLNNRWEHYWDLIAGRHGDPDSLTGSLIKGMGQGGLALAQLFDATFNAILGQIAGGWARLLAQPPTSRDVDAHVTKLNALADDDASFVLIAHSQGNLFLNAAVDALIDGRPETKVKAVHVAPASPTTRGAHGLSGFDLVVNALRIQGITSVPPANWSLPFSWVDASGHELISTYLDPEREGRTKVKELITSALDGL